MPQVDIGSSAVNIENSIRLGGERWLLATRGPAWGPAILFWSHLVILLIIAVLLGRLRNLPVATWEWLLLVIGLSQLPVIAGLPVVFWFVLLAWRRHADIEPWWRFDLVQLAVVALTLVALVALYGAIHTNLLFEIDMQVKGAGSTNEVMKWYVDQTESTLPTPAIVSVPILVWRVAMLLWAFWLVSRLLKWARWGWDSFSQGGLWKKPVRGPKPAPDTSARKGKAEAETTERTEVSQFARAQEAAPQKPEPTTVDEVVDDRDGSVSEDKSEEKFEHKRKKHDTVPGGPQATSHETSGVLKSEDGRDETDEEPAILPPPVSEVEEDDDQD